MLISCVSTNNYEAVKASAASVQDSSTGSTGLSVVDKVTLSSGAMRELEKLAMHAEQTAEYLPKLYVLNNSDSH